MGNNTAQVQTLTAEVKVVVYGNRQITNGVFKQLDIVDYDLLVPFGRVTVDPKITRDVLKKRFYRDYGIEVIWVVGRHKVTNALVRTYVVTGDTHHRLTCEGGGSHTQCPYVKDSLPAHIKSEQDWLDAMLLDLIVLAG